jgi:hypothetical protein
MRYWTHPWRPVSCRNARIPAANRGRYPLRTTPWRPSAAAPKHQHSSALSALSTGGTASRTRLSPEADRLGLAQARVDDADHR